MAERVSVSLTTDASGDVVGNTPMLSGHLNRVEYDGGFDATADFTIATAGGVTVWTESDVAASATFRAPRLATHASDGTASLYASTGEPVLDRIYLAHETIDITVAQGGNAQAGVLVFVLE